MKKVGATHLEKELMHIADVLVANPPVDEFWVQASSVILSAVLELQHRRNWDLPITEQFQFSTN